MKLSIKPNEERIKSRRKEVMEAAWRARGISNDKLTKEAASFIEFSLKVADEKRGKKIERSNYNNT